MTRLGHLSTEAARPERAEIDRLPTGELVRLMNEDDQAVALAVAEARAQIAAAIDAIVPRLQRGGRLVYVGAGTAGRLGVLDASECGPTFNSDQVVGFIAGGAGAVSTATEAAEDDAHAGAGLPLSAGDAVVGISASGRTPYVLGALEHADAIGATTIALVCNPDTPLARAAQHAIEVVVGPEFIAGSTRLKAGTAQKLVLNMLSTLAMVRLGKTYGNLMVDVRVTNEKLRDRATRIVEQVTGAPREQAVRALAQAGDDAKVASVMLRVGVSAGEARERLTAADGHLRRALGE
ncbi:N-acetylmuramic acid 6-phosphate etherase [Solirubrobacter sp. CPCC 204708]|uniref:N-acetylmuramic acid 6-phosphate etherase n=1 Tax=Solirubrobacter deserti TaxID=2282478 RepID=A0ABT4REE0_9ACTN|nr:N-acetylmuramic acid 6-phosphate etherase [Solirubrobacter deserti]MBE2316123.1 N-acetylmuramic acid 6-phosphate etherase [Solirubrobacter deserti]MDA0136873.1 N-acetylmuramic acid 6-phosphate etherase [Solirubrobacter deserti]